MPCATTPAAYGPARVSGSRCSSRKPFRLGVESSPFTPWPNVDLSNCCEWRAVVVPLQGDDLGDA
eukprot:2006922-Alexandrium_andersonii.AAC.1